MKLLHVLSFGQTLENLINKGLWNREEMGFRALHDEGVETVWLFTYGRADIKLLARRQQEGLMPEWIKLLPYPSWLKGKAGKLLYSFWGPRIHKKAISELDIVKSSQTNGSWVASKAARLCNKPFVYRTGYTVTRNLAKQHAPAWKQRLFAWIERKGHQRCDAAIVTSYGDKEYALKRYQANPDKVHVITNFVDTRLFSPRQQTGKHEKRLLFIGRLAQAKNLESLIDAFAELDWGLDLVGGGESGETLKAQVQDCGADVQFLGRFPQEELPELLSAYRYFILPSHYEGMPKALLEAMSCGLCCIGTDVSGIKEVIQHEKTGILIPATDAQSIRKVILSLEEYDAERLGNHARAYIEERHSLEGLAKQEAGLLREILKSK
ncbi:MAG: glycosyltransferase [Bacteroidia bacterium]